MTSNRQLARTLGVDRAQVRRWRQRGLHPGDPVVFLAELARQRNPGITFHNLCDAAAVGRVIDELEKPQAI